ncbi:pentatricopeptide repeat-containing protein At2g13600-like [Asparagus officinalis]|uniref:pentatricopeptide repeat-containing protein At2g13600-like n=1 Tax=Asparagus officinalis TaxID=4686 RepID=UPI00098E2AE6|nr:pentatricopeptide repeat-containing protein At2g13600-like [Asparagus officinalis]
MPRPTINTTRTIISSLSRSFSSTQFHSLPNSISYQQSPYSYKPLIDERFHLFRQFQASGSDPDVYTISKALSSSLDLNALDNGTQLHAFLLKRNVPMDITAMNSLINLYLKCGCIEDAERIFHGMSDKDVFSWTIMVSGYASNGKMKKALELFEKIPRRNSVSWNSLINGYQIQGNDEIALKLFSRMRQEGEPPNKITFIAVLKSCSGFSSLFVVGIGVHGLLVKSSWINNIMIKCTVMDMYAKHGDMLACCKSFDEISEHSAVSWSILLSGFAMNGNVEDVEMVFKEMPEKNIVSRNVMITSYVQNEMQDRAFDLFVDMIKEDMTPNCFTMTSLLGGCSIVKYTKKGRTFHGYLMKVGLESDLTISNSLIKMYGEQSNIEEARLVFEEMNWLDVVSWTTMVSAYIYVDYLDEARYIFDRMPEKNLISWNTMMSGYLQNGKSIKPNSCSLDDALVLFYDLERSKIKPDHFSYNCALTACAKNEALEQARSIHCRVIKRGFELDLGVSNALISVYGKCGSLNEAEKCFKIMPYPDMISWNALLTCYSQNGQGNEVLTFYEEMQNSGVKPNHVTFISLLSACSHIGEVKKGQEFFDEMEKDSNINPNREHYTCMVDLLGRAGLLYEAEALIKKMPIEPDATLWGALLGACKMHGDPALGKKAADQIFRLETNNSAAHIALAETFATAKMWEDVAKIRAMIKDKKLVKEPGLT